MAKRADTLDDLLLANGESFDAFCKRAGVPRFSLLRIRKGEVKTPRIATLTAIAKALGVDPSRVRAACEASRRAAE